MLRLSCLIFLALPTIVVRASQRCIIRNECPAAINAYVACEPLEEGRLAAYGGQVERLLPDGFSSFIHTDANGGWQDGVNATKAWFGESYYYFIGIDPSNFNTAISIRPIESPPRGGFCLDNECTAADCPAFEGFDSPTLPPHNPVPPSLPLFACPEAKNTGFIVTFCPEGTFPPPPPRSITTIKDTKKCLDVSTNGGAFANGRPVQIKTCDGSAGQKWLFTKGDTKVRLAGTNFCLDAGTRPANGVGMKIWQCYDNLPAQAWHYSDNDKLLLRGNGQCLDLRDGGLTNGNPVQTWACASGNRNQIWLPA